MANCWQRNKSLIIILKTFEKPLQSKLKLEGVLSPTGKETWFKYPHGASNKMNNFVY